MWLKSLSLLLFLVSECLPTKITKITRLAVPSEVRLEDGTAPEVLLDCEYEQDSDYGLVVSWHYNGDKIYQWIVDRNIRSFKPTEPFKSHLDHEYSVSDVPNQKYRALRLTTPDASFSGEYECKVSNFASEDSQGAYLQFYELGEGPRLQYEILPGNDTDDAADDQVLLQCDAALWFPNPDLAIFVDGEMANQPESIESEGGLSNVTANAVVSAALLESGAQIWCELTLPNTSYTANETITYTTGLAKEGESARGMAEGATAAAGAGSPWGSVTGGAGVISAQLVLMMIAVLTLLVLVQ